MQHPTSVPVRLEPIHHAVGVLAPLWTSWTLETLCERGHLRSQQLASALPWLNMPTLHQVLVRMQSSGLLIKPERGCYAVSRLGQDARPVHRALASWHARHYEARATSWKGPDRVEDALARLRGRGAVEVLTALEQHGPLRPGALREAAGMATGSFHYRTRQLLDDGLVTRLGPEEHFAYDLTPAARGLGAVYAELHVWGRRSQTNDTTTQSHQHSAEANLARAARQSSLTAAATTRSFSHPPEPLQARSHARSTRPPAVPLPRLHRHAGLLRARRTLPPDLPAQVPQGPPDKRAPQHPPGRLP
ncbi:hypothetical protein [Streptomyces sp. Ru73]|uniref:winged helix-turn-helix transcriptional regulator n=1 Tax=Streptomyces sp. Ru73 TaxID=2080748 RepID=UPI0026AFEA0F|nr:hypothetical protein [Streptomyces sp. Ru73]